MAGTRKNIPAATQAALWALSSGRCCAPGCPSPVIVEVRAGVCRKNAQIGHIYGVKPGAPRLRADTPDEERDAFANLLLLCLRASRRCRQEDWRGGISGRTHAPA